MRMHRLSHILLSILLAAAPVSAFAYANVQTHQCNWQSEARQEHRTTVRIPLADVSAFLDEVQGDGVDKASIATARGLLRRARSPLPLGAIEGRWKVRSIQVDRGFAYAYPFFNARISRLSDCDYRFAKISGSQRRAGTLYPLDDDKRQLAFLGASTVNNDPVRAYDVDSASEYNSAGRLLRIGRNELLMVLDAGDDGFELYHLKR